MKMSNGPSDPHRAEGMRHKSDEAVVCSPVGLVKKCDEEWNVKNEQVYLQAAGPHSQKALAHARQQFYRSAG